MPLKFTLFFFFFSQASSSIYDALASHGLPMGLLPKGVRDYDLNSDGTFEARLDDPCNAEFESRFHFDRKISGRLGFGKISNLTGIEAQELFLWFPVKGVRVDVPSSGLIYFDVGVVFKQFPVYLFESPPDCFAGVVEPEIRQGETIIQSLVKKKQVRDPVLTRKNLFMTKNQENKKKMSSK